MKILLTNDDGYKAGGMQALVRVMKRYGEVTVVAPKSHQSGMSMAVSMGLKPIAVKDMGVIDGVRWVYLDATPASCAKYAVDVLMKDDLPDLVVSGINHGLNSSTAMWYSGTIGAAREAAFAGIRTIAVSLDNMRLDADFSVVEELLPSVFEKLMANMPERKDIIYNINFPNIPASEIKGVRSCIQGRECWIKEFVPFSLDIFKHWGVSPEIMGVKLVEPEEGEELYVMAGEMVPSELNTEDTDNWALENGYISITPHPLDNTDMEEFQRLKTISFQ